MNRLPPLDVLTSKWPGVGRPVQSFNSAVGIDGGIVSDTNLYRGFAHLLKIRNVHVDPSANHANDLKIRLSEAVKLLSDGLGFVLVHLKSTDEAGHTKDPLAKLQVLEALDREFGVLLESRFSKMVIAITGDHATPSRDGVLHTGDPTPFVMLAPTIRPDSVIQFGESFAAQGSIGRIQASDVLPILMSAANRPSFSGTRTTLNSTIANPDRPEPMPS
jgi:2,3-bisphosphoglycerate-independent phosphoglycerate mutase